MSQSSSLLESWSTRVARKGWLTRADLTDAGVVLGAETIIAPALDGSDSEDGHDRLVALLATTYRGRVPFEAPSQIEKALASWQRSDKFLAGVHLAFARLPPLQMDDAYRLSLADLALDKGITPALLLEGIGHADLVARLRKFNPAQPRVPAGEGAQGGQWTKGGAEDTASWTGSNIHLAANTTTNLDYACKVLKLDRKAAGSGSMRRKVPPIWEARPSAPFICERVTSSEASTLAISETDRGS